MSDAKHDFSKIPAKACTLVVGDFELGDNGEDAKSAPVRLVARSGKPIEHWFWGRVVHDLAGMHMHKPRVPIDYVHDPQEVIGYLNHFDAASGDLVTSGALVPFKQNDRATEIIHKSKAGVPYEASINFGGDGIVVQEVAEGERTRVNGTNFDGPGIVIREWPLRGVAICPYGADMNTDSMVFSNENKVFSASVVTEPKAAQEETSEMSASVDTAAPVDTPEADTEKQDQQDAQPVEETPAEAVEMAVEAKAPEGDSVETTEGAEGENEQPEAHEQADQDPAATAEPRELSREEFTRIADEFGADIAVQTVRDGGGYESALTLAFNAARSEVEALRNRVAELEKKGSEHGSPVPVREVKTKESLFKTGK